MRFRAINYCAASSIGTTVPVVYIVRHKYEFYFVALYLPENSYKTDRQHDMHLSNLYCMVVDIMQDRQITKS